MTRADYMVQSSAAGKIRSLPNADDPCSNPLMDSKLTPMSAVLERADGRLRSPSGGVRLWPTGFPLLDEAIGGGLRAGTLNLLAGPQGQGKTMFALQLARAAVKAGRTAVFFSYELEADSLVQRLVAMEAGELDPFDAPSLSQIRSIFEGTDGGAGGLIERLATTTTGTEALLRVSEYADRFVAHRSTATHTDITEINDTVKKVIGSTGESPLIIVDYLQKVAMPLSDLEEDQRITRVTEQLKDVAIEFDCPVFAVAAMDHEGLEPGSRMRTRHMRGSTALSYEPDVVLILATKADIVARHHLVFGAGNADRFREWSVLTLEKNRSGSGGAEFEFKKRFDQGRFEPGGQLVSETLVDERVFTE
jgi:replicative DNA helicase